MNSYYTNEELGELNLKSYGENVLISRKTSIYGAEEISLGNNVRIDDFCILSGKIQIGNNVHIAPYSGVFGGSEGIIFYDFSGISSRVCIYASSDDYSGNCMTNPTVPDKYRAVIKKPVILKKHVIVGSGSILLPGVVLGEGTAIGALSLVSVSTDEWSIYIGIPAKRIKKREIKILELESEYLNETK